MLEQIFDFFVLVNLIVWTILVLLPERWAGKLRDLMFGRKRDREP
jgi:hypothetical protein